jgi:dimeric dUTPase (all-alpha-NTP-PPase superfamily)
MDIYNVFNKMANTVSGRVAKDLDVTQIMNSEMNSVVDYGLWLETVEIQKSFNESIAPGWQLDKQHQKYDFWMAVLDETVEVLGSRHWKWWKNSSKMGDIDWDNIKVELIDIFHFLLSIAIQQDMDHVLFSQLVNIEMTKDENPIKVHDEKFFEEFWNEFLMGVQMKILPITCLKLIDFWYKAGGDANELFKEYRIKAALNNIRQEFGYGAANTYEKMWLDVNTNTKVEDNVIAWKLAQDIPLNAETTKNITDKLRDYYIEHVAI